MTDLTNEERNEKIRKQWLEVIETNESLFANLLKKENLPSEKLLEIEKRQKEGQELKKRIEDGHIPDEPPIRGYKRVDQQWVPLTEKEGDELEEVWFNLEEFGDVTIDPPGGLSRGMNEEEWEEHLNDFMPLRKHKKRAKRIIDKTRENSKKFLKKLKESRDKLSEINTITDEYLPENPIIQNIVDRYKNRSRNVDVANKKDKKQINFLKVIVAGLGLIGLVNVFSQFSRNNISEDPKLICAKLASSFVEDQAIERKQAPILKSLWVTAYEGKWSKSNPLVKNPSLTKEEREELMQEFNELDAIKEKIKYKTHSLMAKIAILRGEETTKVRRYEKYVNDKENKYYETEQLREARESELFSEYNEANDAFCKSYGTNLIDMYTENYLNF